MAARSSRPRAPRSAGLAFLALAGLVLLPAPAWAQQGNPFGTPPKAADLPRNLGGLGIRGLAEGTGIKVKEILAGGPALGSDLEVGDLIVMVGGRPLSAEQDPFLQVLAEVERCEGGGRKKPLVLGVLREGRPTKVSLELISLGNHSRSCPLRCDKCDTVLAAAVKFLISRQSKDGSFPTLIGGKAGQVVVTSLSGLALLAAGAEPTPESPLLRATDYVLRLVGAPEPKLAGPPGGRRVGGTSMSGTFGGARPGMNTNQENWELAYGLMFLAEMAHHTKREDLQLKCQELVARLNKNQEASGGWGHGPGGANPLGYTELEIMSNYALLGMGAAQRLGCELDPARVERALAWVEGTAAADGGVGYSQQPGQQGVGEAGRTAGALVAFASLDQRRRPFFAKMTRYLGSKLETLEEGHVSPAMHMLAGAMAARVLGPKMWTRYLKTYRARIMGLRMPSGSFAHVPTSEARVLGINADQGVGESWLTATHVLILSLPRERLPLLLGTATAAVKKGSKR